MDADRRHGNIEITQVVRAIRDAAGPRRPVVLLDGRSGSGKSVLAASLAPALDAQLLSLDDVYPGWDGLERGSEVVHETVLRERDPGWMRWDWASGTTAEWHPIDPDRPLLVEGCGALSRANRALATFGIWLELDAAERHRRFSERDAGRFDDHWDSWSSHERTFIAREHPADLADLVIDQSRDQGQAQPSSPS